MYMSLAIIYFMAISMKDSAINVLDTCDINKFKQSLARLTQTRFSGPGATLLPESFFSSKTIERYKNISELSSGCQTVGHASETWPMTKRYKKPFVINAGEGTTATRFMACAFRQLGYLSSHAGGKHAFRGCKRVNETGEYNISCTEAWDLYDYVSDSPVPYQFWSLLETHPDAVVLLSVRNPYQWRYKRIKTHQQKGAANWRQAIPCGASPYPMKGPWAPTDFAIYNAWVACLVNPKRLFVYNLFNESTQVVLTRLYKFLRKTQGILLKAEKTTTMIQTACGELSSERKANSFNFEETPAIRLLESLTFILFGFWCGRSAFIGKKITYCFGRTRR
eukprot:m.339635 g.339635  ORF g.339635 m.339635 type:complete len:336 (-) comp18892_c0_seq1:1236-2243(-)